ncbi:MED14-domain-containing protein [Melanomma pulvis-pyrius CBS 109.77]|uniref:Mediator of RNA polymerase II transcription subunit 14 n=1 Tax=Melanomma pulvis-pyrius CBS 109.77 TaxID=1314802 RepID=A0A6A6WNN7_9PLEO|nr:MED14-domain-containing protein [Melanomma pulvis-pyrius CBS 109.77]
MDHSGADGATGPRDGESKKRSHDGKLISGERNVPRRDPASANGQPSPPPINGAVMSISGSAAPAAHELAQLPPEIIHIAAEFYHPLSKLLLRIAQECYNELSEVIQTMAEIPVDVYPNGVLSNGMGAHAHTNGGSASSEANKEKKKLLIKFAHDQRAKFIKLLVLTEWGRKSSVDVCKLVDIFQWAKDQNAGMDSVDMQMMNIKMFTNHARQFNPDIRTALEVLSTGKAAWIPDMGFIPPDPISSEKALKLLRYLNTTLSIRLNVHENLPPQLRKWHVASGRATFVVDSEFELDVLCYSEDTSDSWVFVDLRLLFSPAPTVTTEGRFYQHFRMQLDNILRLSGLSGCFDFLHNFILTHKIALLKSQAYDLLRIGWAGSLKVEPVHRALVVQYWTEKPGKKSWIEIGLSSGNPKNGKPSWRGPPVSFLTVRWFRSGVEVKDAELKFDWKNISMERILKRVIVLHVDHILRTGQDTIPTQMVTKATLSETEPCDCVLEVSLGSPDNKMTVSLETVTGKYILQPATPMSARAENFINQGAELGSNMTKLLGQTLQDQMQRHAQQLGWKSVAKHALRLDVVKEAVKLNVLYYSMYWPAGWTTNWALAALIDPSGESWWIVELGARGKTITYVEQLKVEKQDGKPPISRATLTSVERLAVQLLSLRVTIRELQLLQKANSLQSELAIPRRTATTQTYLRGWVLHVKTADLLTSKSGEDPWLEPGIRVMCQGFRSDYRNIWHIASGTMVKSVAEDMQKLMSASPQKNFTFSENGNFSILLSTPFGDSVFDELKRRLRDLDRLRSFTTTLQKRKMKLTSSSLQQVEFQYGKTYTTTVNFGQENDIKVDFSPANPHNRIRKLLVEIINERNPEIAEIHSEDHTALDRFCTTLIFTRPILSTLSELEAGPGNLRNPAVHTHAIGKYRIAYDNPLCSFDVRIRPKDDKVCWQIEDNDKKATDVRPSPERSASHKRLETLKVALDTFFKSSGEGWFGIRSGIIAEVDGIPAALRKLHETVMSCAMEGGYRPTMENGGRPTPPQALPSGPGPSRGPGPGNGRQPFSTKGNSQMHGKNQQEVIELD